MIFHIPTRRITFPSVEDIKKSKREEIEIEEPESESNNFIYFRIIQVLLILVLGLWGTGIALGW